MRALALGICPKLTALGAAALLLAGASSRPPFRVSTDTGVDFVLENSATPNKHQIETMVTGVAAFDYDNDGLPDLYFANGARQPDLTKAGERYHNRLYRNKGNGKFEDVTVKAGVQGRGFCIGVATADYDNDGFTDIFVAGVNHNILYRNLGNGVFADVTAQAGVSGVGKDGAKPWAVAAGWFDADNDGRLDLFVSNYVRWDPKTEPFCGHPEGEYRTYCHPRYYQGLPNALYRNNGDGTFTDVSASSGIGAHIGKGMGVAFADYNQDGLMDVFLANDTVPSFLFRNEGHGRFREVAMEAGVAFNDDGRAISSMGVDFRDLDNDGLEDLFVTAIPNETFPVYFNIGRGLFADLTYPSRVGVASLAYGGWSNGIFDFNNDGWKDLFAAGSDVQDNTELYSSRKSRLPSLLLLNTGKRTFKAHDIGEPALHRGAAFADFDLDGRIDVAVSRIGQPAVLLINEMAPENHWIGLRLSGTTSNRDGIGAKVRLRTPSGVSQWNHATTSVGYGCSSDRVVHFGLGREDRVESIEIRWPSGKVQELKNLKADRYLEVREP